MELKQPEIIQILRKRASLNQGTFGAKAFDTSFESGRTKVKNIELGKQKPTPQDLANMARVLGVPVTELSPNIGRDRTDHHKPEDGLLIRQQVLDLFPGVGTYLDMLNKAVALKDRELIRHLSEKISEMFRLQPAAELSRRVV